MFDILGFALALSNLQMETPEKQNNPSPDKKSEHHFEPD